MWLCLWCFGLASKARVYNLKDIESPSYQMCYMKITILLKNRERDIRYLGSAFGGTMG